VLTKKAGSLMWALAYQGASVGSEEEGGKRKQRKCGVILPWKTCICPPDLALPAITTYTAMYVGGQLCSHAQAHEDM
jgi:hypothetical protein